MPETNVTVSFIGEDDVTPTINKIKGEMAALAVEGQKIVQAFSRMNISPQRGLSMISDPRQVQAVQAYMASLREVKGVTDEVGEATGHARSQFERIGQRIVEATLIYGGLRLAIDAVKMAFTESMGMETGIVQLQNLNLGVANVTASLGDLQRVSAATGIATKDFLPAIATLEASGESLQEASAQMEHLGKIADITGQPIAKVAEMLARLNLREAGIGEMLSYAQMMGPDIEQMALDYQSMTVDAPIIAREEARAAESFHRHMQDLERAASLQSQTYQRQTQDIQRQTSAQDQFAAKTGLLKAAFQSMVTGTAMQLPAALQGIVIPNELVRNLQSQMKGGEAQISKETGISTTDIGRLVERGALGPEDLTAGYNRAEQARTTAFDRAQQDQREYWEAQQTGVDRAMQDQKEMRAIQQEGMKFGLMAAEREYLAGHLTPEQAARVQAQMAAYQDTFGSKVKEAGAGVTDFMGNMGAAFQETKKSIQETGQIGPTFAGEGALPGLPSTNIMSGFFGPIGQGIKDLFKPPERASEIRLAASGASGNALNTLAGDSAKHTVIMMESFKEQVQARIKLQNIEQMLGRVLSGS